MTLIAILLAAAGLWISIYFTGVSYHLIPPNVKWIPQVCQLKEASCQLVIHTPRAKLFGIPNSVYGVALFTYLILFFVVGAIHELPPPLWWIAFVATGFAVIRSIYLAYSLIFITKVPCPLCFTSHVINSALLIYLWFGRNI